MGRRGGWPPVVHWPTIPPWILPVPEIDLSVLAYERTATFGGIVKERLTNGDSTYKYTLMGLKTQGLGSLGLELLAAWRRSGQGQL